jgi:hypothetical protein
MSAIEPEWVLPLLVVLYTLVALNTCVTSILPYIFGAGNVHSVAYIFGPPTLLGRFIYAFVLTPCAVMVELGIVVYIVAIFTSPTRAARRELASVVLRPYLLALLTIGIITFSVHLLTFCLRAVGLAQYAPVALVGSFLDLALTVYAYVASVNALAAVSRRSRWLLFAIVLLGIVEGDLLGWLLLGAVLAIFGIHALPLTI